MTEITQIRLIDKRDLPIEMGYDAFVDTWQTALVHRDAMVEHGPKRLRRTAARAIRREDERGPY